MAVGAKEARRSSPGWIIVAAALGAATVTSGIQAVAPAIPAIQEQFGLSTAEVALITSVYLFPSMFSGLVAGALADRIGIRPVFSAALLLFGAGGVALLVWHSLEVLLAVRFLQGAAFGAVLSMSVSIIAGVAASGPAGARAQGRRIVFMATGEAAFPATAGFLLALSWYAPFALQLLALPAAVLCWLTLPAVRPRRKAAAASADLRTIVATPAFVGVQALGALRFIFKFGVLTYFSVLAVNETGMSPGVIGAALGASFALTALMAWLTERLARRWSSAELITACLMAISLSMLGMGVADGAVLMILALLLFGVQDGVFGVAQNVMVTELAPADVRSTYIGLTGAVRNVGKFTAPLLLGAATLVVPLSQSFLLLAGVALATVGFARHVGSVQSRLARGTDEERS